VTAPGDTTYTLPGGARFVIRTSAAETGGERVELEMTLPAGAAGPPPHFHPRQDEQWHVLGGTLAVQVDGNWRDLREGESATIPAGHVHTLRNRTNETVRVLDVHIPALDFQDYMLDLHRLAQEGKITNLRSPKSLIYLATVLREHRTTQLTASRPQRIAESALAGVGRLLRMRVRAEPGTRR
jgi:mannose-6-phosphate isomerase-like protein (cupin superfamily)